MRRAVRAIIIKDNQLLVMHRNKFGTEYDTLPGGGIDVGETPEQSLLRELAEETNITIKEPRLVFLEHAGDPYGDQYIFLCTYVSGEPALHGDSEEMASNKMGQNLFEPKWLPLEDLQKGTFRSVNLRQAIADAMAHGWPENVVEIS